MVCSVVSVESADPVLTGVADLEDGGGVAWTTLEDGTMPEEAIGPLAPPVNGMLVDLVEPATPLSVVVALPSVVVALAVEPSPSVDVALVVDPSP